jgi:2-keto-4-pentenoate hydratase/2-oxohepta-3-ene-1,7-dioic acid hydratase in catechol pathway
MTQHWHLWLCEANYRAVEEMEGIPARPYVLAYQAPAQSLTEGGPVVLPPHGRTISCACELAVELDSEVHQADETAAFRAIRGYRALAGFRDSALIAEVPQPTARDEGVCVYYARWADTFNCVSPLIPRAEIEDPYTVRMQVTVDGYEPAIAWASDYLHRAPAVIAALSQFATLQPGDIISLGRAGEMVTLPADQRLAPGTRVVAEIADVGQVAAVIRDERRQTN